LQSLDGARQRYRNRTGLQFLRMSAKFGALIPPSVVD
jgi:hypothetical protein